MLSSSPEAHIPRLHHWKDETATNKFSRYLLCLPDEFASAVTAAVAILVTYAGAKMWTVVRFSVYFWVMPNGAPQECLRGLVLALRNSETSFTTCTKYLQIAWQYRLRERRSHLREHQFHIISIVSLSFLYSLSFTVLGALTPGFISQRNAVIHPGKCGYYVYNTSEFNGEYGSDKQALQMAQHAQFVSNGTATALAWIDACYGPNAKSSLCEVLGNRRIPWTGVEDDCPFEGQCVGGDKGTAYTMDTGNITMEYFGINRKSGFTLRRISTCAPIVMAPYMVEVSAANPVGGCAHLIFNGVNATQVPRTDFGPPYLVNAWYPQPGMFVHPNLQTPTGNVSIIYVSRNSLIHLYRATDPIFSASEEVPLLPFNTTGYIPTWNERLSAVACVEKLQLCRISGKQNSKECAPWTGMVRSHDSDGIGVARLEDFYERCGTDEKGLIRLLFPRKSFGMTVGHTALGAGSNIPAAKSLLSVAGPDGKMVHLQTAKGNDQWKTEVTQYFNLILAIMQLAVLYFPTGHPFLNTSLFVDEMHAESRFICHNVRINTSRHTSIRYLDIVMIVVWSLMVMVLNRWPGELLGFFSELGGWGRGRDIAEWWGGDHFWVET